jgi:hypothetical protein
MEVKSMNPHILSVMDANIAAAKTDAMRKYLIKNREEYVRLSTPKPVKRQPNWDRFIENERP